MIPVFFRALEAPMSAALARPWPWRWRCGLVLAMYAAYLPWSGADRLPFDAGEYWGLAATFFKPGLHFSLLNYAAPLRGYLFPLLLVPGRVLCYVTGWPAVAGAQVLGALWATLLFGVAIPQLWAQVAGRPPIGGRWMALVGLTFVFWRGYFNFSLSDMPALTLLLLSLVALGREGWAWSGAVGILLAATINIRPIYIISVPSCLALLWWRQSKAPWQNSACLALGAALVLLPQMLINQKNFDESTPLVLARLKELKTNSLYLDKLNWGLEQQKYETNIGSDYPASVMLFRDESGARLLRNAGGNNFLTYQQYVHTLLNHPMAMGGIFARRLFNGLDLQYSTPYVLEVYKPAWGLAWLNYTMWFGALATTVRVRFCAWKLTQWLVLITLLMPCVAVLPMSMEPRFLVVLHLLLCAVLSMGWPSDWTLDAYFLLPLLNRLLIAVGYIGFVCLCFVFSAAVQATLEFGPRSLF